MHIVPMLNDCTYLGVNDASWDDAFARALAT